MADSVPSYKPNYSPAPYKPAYKPEYPAYPKPAYPAPSYPKSTYPEPAYPKPAYPEPAYPKPAYPEPAYPKPAYPEPSYPKPAYPEPSYPKPAYPKPAYPEPAYPKPAYPKPAYPEPSYPAPSYKPAYKPEYPASYPKGYDYDDYTYNDYSHAETSDDKGYVTGVYKTLLPDGRTQIVNYKADDYTGYVADVKFRGKNIRVLFWEHSLDGNFQHPAFIIPQNNIQQLKRVNPDVRLSPNDDLAASGIPIISKSIKGYLRAVFTRTPEEFIMTLHDHLMTTSLMAHVAKHIGLSDIILCTDFPCKEETLAKTLHAVVAALVQSSGEERARIFVQDLIVTQLYGKDVNEIWNPVDPVGILRSILAREGRAEAEFRLIRKAGSDTILSVYHVGIYSDRNLIGTGTGENVQVAQEMASRDALKRLFLTDDAMKALPFGRQLKSMRGKIVECESRPNISLSEWTLEKAARSV
nr:EOG090X0DYO [Sida crystallina]